MLILVSVDFTFKEYTFLISLSLYKLKNVHCHTVSYCSHRILSLRVALTKIIVKLN